MMASIYAKLAAGALLLGACLGLFLWGHHVGATGVQAKWDAQKAVDAIAVAKVEAKNAATAKSQQDQFNALEAKYEQSQKVALPSIADATSASITGGTLELRDITVCPGSGNVTTATAASRAADAAATQALADRVTTAIQIVRLGDTSDARERQLDDQIAGLQGLLNAERNP
jgi:hypothetical protein